MSDGIKSIHAAYLAKYQAAGHMNPEAAAEYATQDFVNLLKGQPQHAEQLIAEQLEDMRKAVAA